MIDDPLYAFCRHTDAVLPPAGDGPLSGLSCGIKDLYDIAGHPTGCGHPLWPETHAIPRVTAPAVRRLVHRIADAVGSAADAVTGIALSR